METKIQIQNQRVKVRTPSCLLRILETYSLALKIFYGREQRNGQKKQNSVKKKLDNFHRSKTSKPQLSNGLGLKKRSKLVKQGTREEFKLIADHQSQKVEKTNFMNFGKNHFLSKLIDDGTLFMLATFILMKKNNSILMSKFYGILHIFISNVNLVILKSIFVRNNLLGFFNKVYNSLNDPNRTGILKERKKSRIEHFEEHGAHSELLGFIKQILIDLKQVRDQYKGKEEVDNFFKANKIFQELLYKAKM
jgi:hypothetical protein